MVIRAVSEKQILATLYELDPSLWAEVLDFMAFLKQRVTLEREQTHTQPLTASDVLQSELVGLWHDRFDIDDSLSFARQLRQQAEHRSGNTDDLC